MLKIQGDDHEKFKELSALAAAGSLSPLELVELQSHLAHCDECQEVFLQFRILSQQALPLLVGEVKEKREHTEWDSGPARERLLMRLHADQQSTLERNGQAPAGATPAVSSGSRLRSYVRMALAAGILLALTGGAYLLGMHKQARTAVATAPANALAPTPVQDGLQKLSGEKKVADDLLAEQAKHLSQLQQDSAGKEQALANLRSEIRALETRASELAASNTQSEEQLRLLSQQRDELNAKLQSMSASYHDQQAEIASLRAERDKSALHASSLEGRIEELTSKNRDQERRLKDTEQFLSSDRDIRELMGARKLYIADVFDVDGSSRTQKPFGRVFYTQGKSLIFYAFDLDRQPGIVNASAFQVWGQRETPQGQQPLPMNLGILYMDNELNRRWVMRFDDPKQLAEIDAVFVTVEPRGGSHKPTSKPFLYALLRNEANHP